MSARTGGVVVLISYYAPPSIGIAAQRLRGYVEHLPEHGWQPVVVAPRDPHFHRASGPAGGLGEHVAVHRTPNPEISRWLRRSAGAGARGPAWEDEVQAVTAVRTGALGDALRRLVRDFLYVPDAQLLWIPWAAAAAAEAARQARPAPTVVLSSSVPYSAHFAGRLAARRAAVPWVAEYRDPWSAAPPQLGRRAILRRRIDERLDHGLVRDADAVVVTSETTAELYRRTFPTLAARPPAVVRNGFEPGASAVPPGPDEPLRLVYSGTLLDASYARPVLDALAASRAAGAGQVFIDVFGPAGPWREAGGGREDPPYLRLHGMVPPAEVPEHLAAASVLLLLQPEERHAQYIAGKLYEYLGARRPVLAALPPGCEAARLLEAHGAARYLRPLSAEHTGEVVGALLADHRAGKLQAPTVPEEAVEPLSRRAQARALVDVLDRVAARHA